MEAGVSLNNNGIESCAIIFALRHTLVRYVPTFLRVSSTLIRPFYRMLGVSVLFGRLATLPFMAAAPYPM